MRTDRSASGPYQTPLVEAGSALLHPLYILRVASAPTAALESLDTGTSAALCAEAVGLRQRLEALAPAATQLLESAVPRLTDRQLCRRVLAVKRDIHNLRLPSQALPRELETLLDPRDHRSIADFVQDLTRLHDLGKMFQPVYEAELSHGHKALCRLWEQDNLRKAISLSSPALFQRFSHAFNDPCTVPASTGDLRKLEDTLLQYYARSATKTSPLSYFTGVLVGAWSAAPSGSGFHVAASARCRSLVQLKGALMRQLLSPLAADFQRTALTVPLQWNRSARRTGRKLRFRAISAGQSAGGRFIGTGESIVEIDFNPTIACIQEIFERRHHLPIGADDLCRSVSALAPKLSADKLHAFLATLFGLQLLLPSFPDYEQDEVLTCVRRRAEVMAAEDRTAWSDHLQTLAKCLDDIASGNPVERARSARRATATIESLACAAGSERTPALERTPIHENCYLIGGAPQLSSDSLAPYLPDLLLAARLVPLLDRTHELRCNLADYFISRFGESGSCDDVEDVLERFDDMHAPGRPPWQHPVRPPARTSSITSRLLAARRAYRDYLGRLLHTPNDADIRRSDLQAILGLVPPQIFKRGISQSYLVQLARSEGIDTMVVNQSFGGRSALLSRFMEAADPMHLDAVRAYLNAGAAGNRFAELTSVFGFNANLHPALSELELDVPPYPHGYRSTRKLTLSELRLCYEPATHSVQFMDREGRSLDIWYLGFLMPSFLPQLQRILASTFTDGPVTFTFGALMRRGLIATDRITTTPRLRIGQLVLSRRSWLIPPTLLPDPGLKPDAFFERVWRWQMEHGFPERVFARVAPIGLDVTNIKGNDREIDWERLSFKNMKPQYIKLTSPRWVRLLQRMLRRHRFGLVLTELLPGPGDQHVTVDAERRTSELHFELTLPDASRREDPAAWHTIRIAYFEQDKTALILGPVKQAVESIRSRLGIQRIMIAVHWRFGPHVDLSVECCNEHFHNDVFPLVSLLIGQWLARHPSTTSLDEAAYDRLSRQMALSEVEPGPFLPLLDNNSISPAVYRPAAALRLPAIVEARERFMCSAVDIAFALLRERHSDPDHFLLCLVAMIALVGDTVEPGGLGRSYTSFRSHADFFFAAHDPRRAMLGRFDDLDRRLQSRIDAVVHAVLRRALDDLPLPQAHRGIIRTWARAVADTASRSLSLAREHQAEMADSKPLLDLAEQVRATTPADYLSRMSSRTPSPLWRAFTATEQGQRSMRTPEFLAYRTTVNFFYALLPLLQVSPVQKFLVCHVVSNSVERVLGIRWQDSLGVAGAHGHT